MPSLTPPPSPGANCRQCVHLYPDPFLLGDHLLVEHIIREEEQSKLAIAHPIGASAAYGADCDMDFANDTFELGDHLLAHLTKGETKTKRKERRDRAAVVKLEQKVENEDVKVEMTTASNIVVKVEPIAAVVRRGRRPIPPSPGRATYECDRCDRFYTAVWILNKHKAQKHGVDLDGEKYTKEFYRSRPFKCLNFKAGCKKAYKWRWQMKAHCKKHHANAPKIEDDDVKDAAPNAALKMETDENESQETPTMVLKARRLDGRSRRSLADEYVTPTNQRAAGGGQLEEIVRKLKRGVMD